MQGSFHSTSLLNDGFFNRSVVYLANHNNEGAFGFVMNFKTHFMLRDVRPQVKNGNFPIFMKAEKGRALKKSIVFFTPSLGNDISDSFLTCKSQRFCRWKF